MTEPATVPEWVYERWLSLMGEEDLEGYRKAGFGGRVGMGDRPALLVIDMTNMYVESRFPMAFGNATRSILPALATLLSACRSQNLPVFFARPTRRTTVERGLYNGKAVSWGHSRPPEADDWPAVIAPRSGDVIIEKSKSSIFHETPLRSILTYLAVDTVIVTGASTSGCIRSAVEDAYSCNFRPIVPEECVADRSPQAHLHNLFDIDMKYADVMPLDDVVARITTERGAATR